MYVTGALLEWLARLSSTLHEGVANMVSHLHVCQLHHSLLPHTIMQNQSIHDRDTRHPHCLEGASALPPRVDLAPIIQPNDNITAYGPSVLAVHHRALPTNPPTEVVIPAAAAPACSRVANSSVDRSCAFTLALNSSEDSLIPKPF